MRAGLVLVLLTTAGCEVTAIGAVKSMRQQACAGDAPGFFSHIDRASVTEGLIAEANAKRDAIIAKVAPADQAAAREDYDRSAGDLKAVVSNGLIRWEDDIKKGPASDFCRMSVIDSEQHDSSADVHVRTPTGIDKYWRLSRFGKRWVMVRLGKQT